MWAIQIIQSGEGTVPVSSHEQAANANGTL
jgi:hypothetical protein